MRFGIFYEHQLPRPWAEGDEHRLYKDALEQIELADRLGYDYLWEVEHHYLEEYSHSSAPEVFLAAASQRTSRIRIGHGIVQLPFGFNHPARVAERPFAGHDGATLKIPPRNLVPKPLQRPHPPLWVACSRRETIHLAATKGIGALSFSFVEASEARHWVDDYYSTITSPACVPGGFSVNPNIACVLPMMVHHDE